MTTTEQLTIELQRAYRCNARLVLVNEGNSDDNTE